LQRMVGREAGGEARAIDAASFGLNIDDFGGSTWAGVNVSTDAALGYISVFAAVNLIADAIASFPVHAYRKSGTARRAVPTQPAWLDDVNGQPNPETDRFTWVHRLVNSMGLDGNAYGLIADRDKLGYPSEIWNLHPDDTTPIRQGGEIRYRVKGRSRTLGRYSRANPNGEVVQVKWFDAGGLRGLSPIEKVARQGIAMGLASEEYGARFFGQGAIPPGIVSVEGAPTPAALKEMAKWFRDQYGGRARAHTPAVMSGAKWEPVSITPEAAQFLETRRFQVSEIARMYRVPPHLIGDVERSTSWGSGIEEQNRAFYTLTLVPWLRRIESTLNALVPRGQYVRFDPAGLLRGDIKARYAAYNVGRQGGWLSVNEIRALEEMDEVDGGDAYLQALNMTAVGQGGNE